MKKIKKNQHKISIEKKNIILRNKFYYKTEGSYSSHSDYSEGTEDCFDTNKNIKNSNNQKLNDKNTKQNENKILKEKRLSTEFDLSGILLIFH